MSSLTPCKKLPRSYEFQQNSKDPLHATSSSPMEHVNPSEGSIQAPTMMKSTTMNSSHTVSSSFTTPNSSRYSLEKYLPTSLEQEYEAFRDPDLRYDEDVEFHAFINTLALADVLVTPRAELKEKRRSIKSWIPGMKKRNKKASNEKDDEILS